MRPLSLPALLLLCAVPWSVGADTLDNVLQRGELLCGVSEGIPGFSMPDADGAWQGLDVDFCRALAAAVLGDPKRVRLVPLRAVARLPALQGGKVDLLLRNTTWTLYREAILGVTFPAVLFYDTQGVMVPAASPITDAGRLSGATVCIEKGTNHARNVQEWTRRGGPAPTLVTKDSLPELTAAFIAGECAAWSGDKAQLAASRTLLPGGREGWRILPEHIAFEPLAPAIWGSDPRWTTIVRWVLYALIRAEEDGVTQANLDARIAAGDLANFHTGTDEERRLLAEAMGIPAGWAARAVRAVGNYGEIFERHLGPSTPLGLERDLNRLWRDGGLMYPMPVR